MNLEIFNKLLKSDKEKNSIGEFINKLKETLDKKQEISREEGLYYVLNANPEKIYITKFGDKTVLEATDLPDEIKKVVSEGFILRYKNGEYTIDEELTDKNFEGELDIDNYTE